MKKDLTADMLLNILMSIDITSKIHFHHGDQMLGKQEAKPSVSYTRLRDTEI